MPKTTRIALAAALLGASSLASAVTESATINVNATVPGVCKLTSTALVDLPITANPSVGGDAFATAPVAFKCTKSHPYTFSVVYGATTSSSGSLTGNLSDGATTPTLVPFTASWTQPSGTGAGFSAAVNADVKVTITEANYLNAPAGSYLGTLKVNIDY